MCIKYDMYLVGESPHRSSVVKNERSAVLRPRNRNLI